MTEILLHDDGRTGAAAENTTRVYARSFRQQLAAATTLSPRLPRCLSVGGGTTAAAAAWNLPQQTATPSRTIRVDPKEASL